MPASDHAGAKNFPVSVEPPGDSLRPTLRGGHHVRVFRFGLRLVRDEQVAENLIGEVFLDVWRQAGKFEG